MATTKHTHPLVFAKRQIERMKPSPPAGKPEPCVCAGPPHTVECLAQHASLTVNPPVPKLCGRSFQEKHGRQATCIKRKGHHGDCIGILVPAPEVVAAECWTCADLEPCEHPEHIGHPCEDQPLAPMAMSPFDGGHMERKHRAAGHNVREVSR